MVRRGSAKPLCTGSIPVAASRVVSSAEERLLDVQKVGGSNPPPPTKIQMSHTACRTLIISILCAVVAGCGSSDKPKPLSQDAWKQVGCLPQKPGEYCLLEGHASTVKALAFTSDGKLLASAAYNGVVKLWDFERGENLYSFVVPREATCSYENYSKDCTPLFFSADKKLIFTIIDSVAVEYPLKLPTGETTIVKYVDNPIYFWDIQQRKIVSELKDCYTRPYKFAVSADGKYIAFECFNRELAKPDEYLDNSGMLVTNVCYFPNAQVQSPESDKFLVVWDITQGKPIRQFKSGTCGTGAHEILALAFRRTEVLAGTKGGEIWLWDINLQKDGDPPIKKIRALGDGVEVIAQKVSFSSDGKKVAMYRGYGNSTIVYDVDSGKELARLNSRWEQGDGPRIFSPDGRYLANVGNYILRIWDVASGELLIESPSHLSFSDDAISFSPNGKFIAISKQDSIALLRFR